MGEKEKKNILRMFSMSIFTYNELREIEIFEETTVTNDRSYARNSNEPSFFYRKIKDGKKLFSAKF